MAVASASQTTAFRSEIYRLHRLVNKQAEQIEKQQAVLDVQFQRIAAIQAELDLVKATVRLVAPVLGARLLGANPQGLTPVRWLPALPFQRTASNR